MQQPFIYRAVQHYKLLFESGQEKWQKIHKLPMQKVISLSHSFNKQLNGAQALLAAYVTHVSRLLFKSSFLKRCNTRGIQQTSSWLFAIQLLSLVISRQFHFLSQQDRKADFMTYTRSLVPYRKQKPYQTTIKVVNGTVCLHEKRDLPKLLWTILHQLHTSESHPHKLQVP